MPIPSDLYATFAIAAGIALLLGALIAWLLTRSASFKRGRGSRDVEVTQLANERDASLEARRRLQQDYDLTTRRLEEGRQRIVEVTEQRAASE